MQSHILAYSAHMRCVLQLTASSPFKPNPQIPSWMCDRTCWAVGSVWSQGLPCPDSSQGLCGAAGKSSARFPRPRQTSRTWSTCWQHRGSSTQTGHPCTANHLNSSAAYLNHQHRIFRREQRCSPWGGHQHVADNYDARRPANQHGARLQGDLWQLAVKGVKEWDHAGLAGDPGRDSASLQVHQWWHEAGFESHTWWDYASFEGHPCWDEAGARGMHTDTEPGYHGEQMAG